MKLDKHEMTNIIWFYLFIQMPRIGKFTETENRTETVTGGGGRGEWGVTT